MSKLLELLRKSRGEVSDVVAPLVDAESRRSPRVSASFKSETGRTQAGPADGVQTSPPAELPGLAQIRTLGLRIPAPSPLLPFENSHWHPSEQYRVLRTKISQHPLRPHLIVTTSPDAGDGKSVTAINTAAALALKSEGLVLLIDADLRKSTVHTQLGLPESPGLAEVLAGTSTVEDALIHTQEFSNLYVLCAGNAPANPVDLLDRNQWPSLCAKLRGIFRYVIMDSPPVSGVADYELIQAVCDGVILVLRPDFTHRQLCLNALECIPEKKFLGVLMNCIPDWSPGVKAGTDYYYYARDKVYSKEQTAKGREG